MKTKFESVLRAAAIPDSATRSQRTRATTDVELLLSAGVHSVRGLNDSVENSRLPAAVRSAACFALGQLRAPGAIPVLLRILECEKPQMTWEAAKALVLLLFDSRKGSRKLKQILLNARGSHNRAAAAYVLGLTGNKAAIPLLVEVLQSSSAPDVRSHAAEALGNIGAGGAVDSLMLALGDPSAKVRVSAAYALGEVGDLSAIGPLKKLAAAQSTRASSASIKAEAQRSINRIRKRTTARSDD